MERKLSMVIPAFNESESLPELYRQIIKNLELLFSKGQIDNYEIWFVSDGSTDDTEQIVQDLIAKDNNVHLIAFRKNFGKATALQAGFHHVSGDIVFTMDADLQDDPAEFERFIAKIDEGYDLVSGWKFNRLDPLEKRLPSKLFNSVTSFLSGIHLHDFDCGFKAYRKEVVKSIELYGELHRYIPVLAFRKGFRIGEITVQHHKREHGHSKYGMERYLRGFFDSLTTTFLLRYMERPMYLFGKIGLLLSVTGFCICLYLSILWCMGYTIGNRPLFLGGVLSLILGLQSFSIGFIGNMIVDISHKNNYDESHIKTIV